MQASCRTRWNYWRDDRLGDFTRNCGRDHRLRDFTRNFSNFRNFNLNLLYLCGL